MTTRYYRFEELAAREREQSPGGQVAAQLMQMYRRARALERPVVLELGTHRGQSTAAFLAACEEADGALVSVDIADCSDVADSARWTFVRADSLNVDAILAGAPPLARGIASTSTPCTWSSGCGPSSPPGIRR